MKTWLSSAILLTVSAGLAFAHASEQGFVLLLPTDIYITAGVASVALTIVLLAVLPPGAGEALFRTVPLFSLPRLRLRHLTSLVATGVMVFLVWRGLTGPRDPLVNPMPLFVWTVWWIFMVSLQGVLGNHWRWTNPWTGVGALLRLATGLRAPLRYPRWLGHWPALVSFIGFAGFLLADIAPTDPARLATIAGFYWYFTLMGLVLFGPVWMVRAEALTVLMRAYARMGLLGRARGRLAAGLPGWQILRRPAPSLVLALFMVILLGTGSFAGLREAICLVAPSILPIALGYHVAHYLTAAMVDGQYVVQFLDDPMNTGAHLLGLEDFYVTTGFFNTPGTVKVIWLAQAGAVVVGHVIAILLAHALAVRDTGSTRRAVFGHAALALFMVAYTCFGLCRAASPRGLWGPKGWTNMAKPVRIKGIN